MTPFLVNDAPVKSLSAPLPKTKAPPCIHNITGNLEPFLIDAGVHILRYRQSSEDVWEMESAPGAKFAWAHSAQNFIASRTPFHDLTSCGGCQRSSPIGAAAYAIPLKLETSPSVIPRIK